MLVFDKRGTGLSDRSLGYGSLEERSDDIRAVMDAAGSQRAVIYGISEAGPMALLFAATYPDRVQALVLYGTWARVVQAPGLSDRLLAGVGSTRSSTCWSETGAPAAPLGGSTSSTSPTRRRPAGSSPSSSATPAPRRWWPRSSSATSRSTCGPILSTISVPTLVMHCAKDPLVPVELGRYLGEHIPGARYVEIDGDFHGSWRTEDMAKLGPPLLEFLGSIGFEEPPPTRHPRPGHHPLHRHRGIDRARRRDGRPRLA